MLTTEWTARTAGNAEQRAPRFLKNAWYAAGWSKDVTTEPIARTMLDEPLVIFRTASGRPAALEDRCAHRAAPLSRGRVLGEVIECGYHGLCFDFAGRCTLVPYQESVPAKVAVRSYPVEERWNMLWVWMGEPDRADAGQIPELPWLSDPAWCSTPGYIHVGANYELIVDNLLDFTHVSYLHRTTLAGDDREKKIPMKVERASDSVNVARWILSCEAPPLFARAGGFGGPVDRWQFATWRLPSTVYLDVGCADAGSGAVDGDRSRGITLYSNHLITPESATSTHYFFAYARNFAIDDPEMSKVLYDGSREAFHEDTVMIEAQQRNLNGGELERVHNISSDAAQLYARRTLRESIEGESERAHRG